MNLSFPVLPSGEAIARLKQLNDEARYLTAWEEAQKYAPLKEWTECAARTEAARLANGLKASKLASALHLLNGRKHPDSPEAFFFKLLYQTPRMGPVWALRKLRAKRFSSPPTPHEEADLEAMRGFWYASLRDFEPAHGAIERALKLASESPWIHVQHSAILEMEDRYDAALEAARQAYALGPRRISPVMQLVDCLVHRNADDEAIELLQHAHDRGESADFAFRLVAFYSEREDHASALCYLEEAERLALQLDQSGKEWVRRRRADLLYLAGDDEGFLAQADALKDQKGYHCQVAKNLRTPGARERRRKRLEVPFVRQHSMTCAPATLAALAAYWGRQFDHLAISDAICYEGTPWHKERLWAEENGFFTAEFRLTREVLVALIDRGVPFTLSTQEVTSAHLQACIGYDDRQGTVILRDPTVRHYGEMILEPLIERHPIHGPRGMVLLPPEELARLEGIVLPDATIYDANHIFSQALDRHDREAARQMLAQVPAEHPIALWMSYRLAAYDANPAAEYEALETLATRFPDNTPIRYWRLGAVQRVNGFSRERELIAAEIAREECDPVFYSEMGDLLMRDARQIEMADYYLRKAVRLRSLTARSYASLGFLLNRIGNLEEAVDYHRAAATLEPSWEAYAANYAAACRLAGDPKKGVGFLQRRLDQQGGKSGLPWYTLADELQAQGRTTEALDLLEKGLRTRSEDGTMLLDTGRRLITAGMIPRGLALMREAKGKVREASWELEMGRVHSWLGQRAESIIHWRAYLKLEPHSEEGHRAMARMLAEEEGSEVTLRYLEEICTAFPGQPALWSLRAEWEMSERGPKAAIPSQQQAVALNPDADWLLRELAMYHHRAGDSPRAFELMREALGRNPYSAINHRLLGFLHREAGQWDESRAEVQRALTIDIDDTASASGLLALATTQEMRKAALAFLEHEMIRQVSNGEIVPEYRLLAYPLLEPEELMRRLRRFCRERPDLWQTWQARLDQALDMGEELEAGECARELTQRFPQMARAWLELARVQQYQGRDGIEALRKAHAISPGWVAAANQLSEALERVEQYDEALEVLEDNLQRNPLVDSAYGYLASLRWRKGKSDEAFACLLRGLRICSDYPWGWETLAGWAVKLGRESEVSALLETLEAARGNYFSWWLTVSDTLLALKQEETAIQKLEEAIRRLPDQTVLYEQYARLLGIAERYEDGLEACRRGLKINPAAFDLKGRMAALTMAAGQPNEAIDQLKAVLEETPDYLWGIQTLTQWLNQRERWEEALVLSKRWVRYAPRTAIAHGYLAQAHRALGERDASKVALERAFTLDPGYSFAGRNLLTLQIEDRDLEEAAQTLRTLEHFDGSFYLKSDKIELTLAQGDADSALEQAEALLRNQESDVGLLTWLEATFEKAGMVKRWWKRLNAAAVKEEQPLPAVLQAWILSRLRRSKPGGIARRLNRLRDDELRAIGWITVLQQADYALRWRYRYWIWSHRRWFHSRADTWSEAGNALANVGAYSAAYRWFSRGVFSEDQMEVVALFNFGVATKAAKGWAAAVPIYHEALARFPASHLAASLRTLAGLDAVIRGDLKEATHLRKQIEVDQLIGNYPQYHRLLLSPLQVVEGDEHEALVNYQTALNYFNTVYRDRGTGEMIKGVQQRLAQNLPWANGRARRVRGRWGDYDAIRTPKDKALLFVYIVIGFFVFVFGCAMIAVLLGP